MNYKFLLIPFISLIMAVSCKDANKEVIEPTVPAETGKNKAAADTGPRPARQTRYRPSPR